MSTFSNAELRWHDEDRSDPFPHADETRLRQDLQRELHEKAKGAASTQHSDAWRAQRIQHLLDTHRIQRIEDLPFVDQDGEPTDLAALDAWLDSHTDLSF